jgi:hypothetical protein
MTIILVAHARGGLFGPTIGRDLRYSTDLALLTPLCAALAWLPLRLHSISAAPQPREDAVRMGPRLRRQMLLAGAFLVVLVTVGGLVSGARYMKIWTNNPSESYVDNLRDGLARATSVTLFDQGVPAHVMIPEFGEGAQLSRLTRALNPRPRFVTWAPELNVVDEQGRIHPAKVEGIGSYLYQPVCGRQKVTVPLTGSVLNWAWKAQITYSSTQATTAEVSMDGRSTPVSLLPGQHDLFVAVMGGGNWVTLSGLEPGARICVTSAVVGSPVPR